MCSASGQPLSRPHSQHHRAEEGGGRNCSWHEMSLQDKDDALSISVDHYQSLFLFNNNKILRGFQTFYV